MKKKNHRRSLVVLLKVTDLVGCRDLCDLKAISRPIPITFCWQGCYSFWVDIVLNGAQFNFHFATKHCKVLFHQNALDYHLFITLANMRLKLMGKVVDHEQ